MKTNKWELYSSMKGWRRASGALSRAMEAALKGKRRGNVQDAVAAYREWSDAARAYREFGALDTEPGWHAREIIWKRLDVRL